MNNENYINELKQKREEYGVSQTRFAVACGISREHYNRIEKGKLPLTEELKETFSKQIERFNPQETLFLLIDYFRVRFPTTDVLAVIRDILHINPDYMLYEGFGKYGYERKYLIGDINVMCSVHAQLGVLLELKGRGCRQMESYLLAQERSWYDFMLDCMTAGGVMKRLDLAINDRAGILDNSTLKAKYKQGECISYFRKQKGYDGTEKCGDDTPKNTGETLYLGSTSSELYMCAYQKNYEQYVKNGTEIEDTDIKNRFEIRMKNERAYYAVRDLLTYRDAERAALSIINHYVKFVDREDGKPKSQWKLNADWKWFIGENREPIRLTTKPEPFTLERALHWLQRQVAPTMKMVQELDKENHTTILQDMIEQAELKDKPLRGKERIIQRDLYDGIDTQSGKMTLCQLYAKKNAQRPNVKKNTQTGRKYLMQALEDDILGSRSIDRIKPSDAREWAIRMKSKGFSYKTISNYKRSLKASFYMAIEDDCVRKNPFDFPLSEVIEDDRKPKVALSEEQEQELLHFIVQDTTYQKYYDDVLILLKTGLRISELCGLTKNDLDFENHAINVNHQLLKDMDGYYIDEPKTKSGIRKVPMRDETEKAFQRVLKRKQKAKYREIDGCRHFLFLNSNGYPMQESTYKTALEGIVKKYNKDHDIELPKITPHTLRHTFCTRLAQKKMNPKNLQYIMGHSSITITLDLYAHASEIGANIEMRSLIA